MTNPNLSQNPNMDGTMGGNMGAGFPNPVGPMDGQQPKRLVRDRNDRMLGGVCSGMAKYLGMDPTLMRVLWVVVTLFTFVPVIAYIVLMFVVPEN